MQKTRTFNFQTANVHYYKFDPTISGSLLPLLHQLQGFVDLFNLLHITSNQSMSRKMLFTAPNYKLY